MHKDIMVWLRKGFNLPHGIGVTTATPREQPHTTYLPQVPRDELLDGNDRVAWDVACEIDIAQTN
jgi:hypothetical protein